ncbi:hypothetical protein MIB92_18760 [Aestuariirhabdus sp. Z084]|uniref:hypothetical protein n=1 Tax=Aestuariirhabdus haliotis TaxID=2918751 RepID=UPI00201B3602|nr:hypothetical protein [Aestuariirhabdus haliotis]MCL6417708.1 hypothetical protein [Aestuariirhabdus haliotis]MCL6421635.1 hypothetical protein [Aestuariirhabdus haliotis]
MTDNNKAGPVPGWIGGFEESNSQFAYPDPNLKSLPMLDNMANIDKLQRQQPVQWPEFSWETDKDDSADPKRCYQMFAPDISRLGYTDEGRVFSIICPQQGTYSKHFGTLNVEVTVTGQRGWVNETTKKMAADMSVVGKVWFSPSACQSELVKLIWDYFKDNKLPFPFNKANAIRVTTFSPGKPDQPIFNLRSGESTDFPIPEFAKHYDEAWDVSNLGVEIGPIEKVDHPLVDDFNQLIMDVFNLGSGNMLQPSNVLTWNVWFKPPVLVNTDEWRTHAERWRDSIDAGHGSPDGPGTAARYFDGTPFKPLENILDIEVEKIEEFFKKHLPLLKMPI